MAPRPLSLATLNVLELEPPEMVRTLAHTVDARKRARRLRAKTLALLEAVSEEAA